MPTLNERVDALEISMMELIQGVVDLKKGQLRAAEQIQKVGLEQREAIRVEGERVTRELLEQSAAILRVAQGLSTLQGQISKWAAGGSLLGAVLLFIAVRALGLG